MLSPNNPDLDPDLLSEKLKRVAAQRRRSQPLFLKPKAAEFTPAAAYAYQTTGIRAVIKRIPLIGPLAVALNRKVHQMRSPGLSRKQRILMLPLIGPAVHWVYALTRLNKIRHELAVQLMEIRAAQNQLNQQIAYFGALDIEGRLRGLDSIDIANRLNRLDSLNIASRLNRFDEINIAQRLDLFDAADIANRLNRLEAADAEAVGRVSTIEASVRAIAAGEATNENLIAGVRQELHRHMQAVAARFPSTSAPVPESSKPVVAPVPAPLGFDMDAFYTEFELAFRGSREDIRERLKVYLPYLAHFKGESARVVDVGCGRGEWLELLKAEGLQAVGIDLNSQMVTVCKERGLAAEYGDAIDYLRRQPEGSLAAVTGFHIIEHLPFDVLIALFDAALHAVRKDGLIIFETPNPENLMVGACNFYSDPTHLHPIVPTVAEFMARQRGFARAEILRLHPYPTELQIAEDSDAARRVNQALYGPQDYAVIAWKTYAN